MDWWALGDLARGVKTAGFIPSLLPALPAARIVQQSRNTANLSTSHTHTHPVEYVQTSPEAD